MRLAEDRHHLVTENMGLVNKYARRMAIVNRDAALDYEDFYSAGCLGLIHAAARYNESDGLRFSTYATRCIIGLINRHKNQVTAIRVPVHIKELCTRIAKGNMENASAEEIAAKFDVPLSRAENALEYKKWHVFSADAPISQDDNATLLDTLGASAIDQTSPYVEDFIATLKPREQLIVKGLLEAMTMREIGEWIGISYQRIGIQVKQIREKWLNYEQATLIN
ncbi:sigma-70 family RNA polymerase sigma factor [Paenibacillus glycanilyticus]|uniref:sigma-70 family RNA polymerase sigma factor n=1 Tax=Paenibacillus glycanilyticus TaxID=126569 RepID=UPI00191020B2|nr:sigma-70 family RNA polymerase sigma factor [Paenibacillus glycanilyticus]